MKDPVNGSKPTCVTCTGFSGAEMGGRLDEPTKLLTKLEKPLFFLMLFADPPLCASSLYRCLGDRDEASERGGVMLSMIDRLPAMKLVDCRSGGFAKF